MSKFSIIITEENNNLSIEIQNYKSKSKLKLDIDAENSKPLTIEWMCKFIIDKIKPKYQSINFKI